VNQKGYPELYAHVGKMMGELGKECSDVMTAFMGLHKAAAQPCALDGATKELIALAIAIAIRCEGCIAFHMHDAIKAGATHEQIVETIGVAVLMGGGPSVVYGSQALVALEEFEAEPA
jgi:AhpD family alkylhydroperoxidase